MQLLPRNSNRLAPTARRPRLHGFRSGGSPAGNLWAAAVGFNASHSGGSHHHIWLLLVHPEAYSLVIEQVEFLSHGAISILVWIAIAIARGPERLRFQPFRGTGHEKRSLGLTGALSCVPYSLGPTLEAIVLQVASLPASHCHD